MNTFDFVQSFCSEDQIGKLSKPIYYQDSEIVVASDGNVLLCFDAASEFYEQHKENILLYEKEKRIVNAIPIISTFYNPFEVLGKISLLEIDSIFNKILSQEKYSYKYLDCPKCEGSGNIECPCCKKDNECEDCLGTGEITVPKDTKGSYYKFPKNEGFKIGECYLGLYVTHQLLERLKVIGIDSLDVIKTEKHKVYYQIHGTNNFIIQMGVDTEGFDKTHILL